MKTYKRVLQIEVTIEAETEEEASDIFSMLNVSNLDAELGNGPVVEIDCFGSISSDP